MGLIEPLTANSQLIRPCFSRHDLLRVIRAVAHGEAIFSPAVATRVLDFFARQHDPSIAPEDFPMLTTRERDVLHLLAQGRSNSEIAARLGLSRKTTSNYVSVILTKLQVRDRGEAAERARQSAGLVQGAERARQSAGPG